MNDEKEPYFEILECCPVPVFIHQDGALVYANPALFEAFGTTREAVRAAGGIRDVFALVVPEEREALASRDRIFAGQDGAKPLPDGVRPTGQSVAHAGQRLADPMEVPPGAGDQHVGVR